MTFGSSGTRRAAQYAVVWKPFGFGKTFLYAMPALVSLASGTEFVVPVPVTGVAWRGPEDPEFVGSVSGSRTCAGRQNLNKIGVSFVILTARKRMVTEGL
jgi:hypothetical protein